MDREKPVAITVSTNFSDILPYSLKYNLDFFKHWFIITAPNDEQTIQVVKEKNDPRITLLFHKFRGNLYINKYGSTARAYFDKGGGVKLGQEHAYTRFPSSWYLVLDTDIIIRNVRDLISQNAEKDCIYGPAVRNDYKSLSDYENFIIHYDRPLYKEECPIIGCFQLYYNHLFYNNSEKSDICDNDFTNLWPKDKQRILNINVDHLGYWAPEVPNTHRGRIVGNGFIIDR